MQSTRPVLSTPSRQELRPGADLLLTLLQDVSYSARSLLRTRGFTLTAVLTLALGIAGNVLVFSVVNAALLRPLPYHEPHRLVVFSWYDQQRLLSKEVSASAFMTLQQGGRSFESVAATYSPDVGVNFSAAGAPRYEAALRVSSEFFQTLGVKPTVGRVFRADEDRPGAAGTAVLSYRLWSAVFDKDSSALGREVRVDGLPYTVVGIMPPDFRSYPDADLWLPLQLSATTAEVGNEYTVIARLKPKTSIEHAQHELDSSHDYALTYPLRSSSSAERLVVEEWGRSKTEGVRKGLMSLFFAALLALLIACTNLAVLLTVRAWARSHEFAIRAALGASRGRLVRVVYIDSLWIALVGGVLGIVLGKEMLPVLTAFLIPRDVALSAPIRIDGQVLGFSLTISAITSVVFGLVPSLAISRVGIAELLRQSPLTARAGGHRSRLGRVLITLETAFTFILLAGAACLLRGFITLNSVSPGFDSYQVFVAQVSLAPYTTTSATARLLDETGARLAAVPGVQAVANIKGLPFESGLNLPLHPIDAPQKVIYGQYRIVSPRYFAAMRIPIVSGRQFDESDAAHAAPVAIVNQTLARMWWPGGSPISRSATVKRDLGGPLADRPREIVGVAADVREEGLDQPAPPTFFVPLAQTPDNVTAFANRFFLTSILVRTAQPAGLDEKLRNALHPTDPELPIASLRPLNAVIGSSLARPRFYLWLTGACGAFAVLLTTIGLYGLLSYQLLLRTREIGVRMAVGAQRAEVVTLIVKQGLKPVAMGVALGLAGFIILAGLFRALLYNLAETAPSALIAAVILLAAVALLTSLVIARRATAIEPWQALESE